jgi:hypothetical protein
MHRISGRINRPFLSLVSGRTGTPDLTVRTPGLEVPDIRPDTKNSRISGYWKIPYTDILIIHKFFFTNFF